MKSTRKPRPFEKMAFALFDHAKELLQTNKYFAATAFLVHRESFDVLELLFQNAEEKYAKFANLVAQAVRTNADAIILIVDEFYKPLSSKAAMARFLKTYQQGDLEAEKAPEALGMIVSSRNASNWGVMCPYKRAGETGEIVFGRARFTASTRLNNLIPESWKTAKPGRSQRKRP